MLLLNRHRSAIESRVWEEDAGEREDTGEVETTPSREYGTIEETLGSVGVDFFLRVGILARAFWEESQSGDWEFGDQSGFSSLWNSALLEFIRKRALKTSIAWA